MRNNVSNFYKTDHFFIGTNNIQSLRAYNVSGREPGGFLRAMLEGDLYRAAASADVTNQQRIYHIAKYIVNTLPAESYGTPEKVRKWINKK